MKGTIFAAILPKEDNPPLIIKYNTIVYTTATATIPKLKVFATASDTVYVCILIK